MPVEPVPLSLAEQLAEALWPVETIQSVEPIPATMTESELGALFGISASQIRHKVREGITVRASRGRYDVRQSLTNYLEHLRGVASRTGQQSDELQDEKLRLAKAQVEKLEIANAAARGELNRPGFAGG